jgi:SPP1 gp7 family putative phage head morphogenesis protein
MTDFDDRKPVKRIAHSYQQEISAHIETLFPAGFLDPNPPAVPDEAALEIAARMVKRVANNNARAWRQAARKAMRGRRIYEALRMELSGSVGLAMQAQIRENAHLISSLPEEFRLRAAQYASEQFVRGVRSSEVERYLREQFPEMLKSRAALIARTQTGRAEAALTRARAENIGIPFYEWRSSGDQRVRISHRKMDHVLVPWNDPPSPEVLAGEKSQGRYAPGEIYNCFPGDTIVSCPSGIEKLWRAPYSGDVIDIEIEGGVAVSATPNHPILTKRGWVAMGLLNVGDELVQNIASEQPATVHPNVNDNVSTFENVFNAAASDGINSRAFNLDFHGDVINDYVDVVTVNRNLDIDIHALGAQGVGYFGLSGTNSGITDGVPSVPPEIRESSFPSFLDQLGPLLGTSFTHSDVHSVRAIPGCNSGGDQSPANNIPVKLEIVRDPLLAPPLINVEPQQFINRDYMAETSRGVLGPQSTAGQAVGQSSSGTLELNADGSHGSSLGNKLCRVIKKRVRKFSGHVFTLQAKDGWYAVTVANIIAKNCRCVALPLVTIEEVSWPALVYYSGRIQRFSRAQFTRLIGIPLAA